MLKRFVLPLMAVVLTACSQPQTPVFKNSDITGADYGKALSARKEGEPGSMRYRVLDHEGNPRSINDFRGKVVSLFFGYTQCPDVCPTNLTTMAEVMRQLGPDAERLQVLFMTVDPERDTQALLAEYVPAFDPRFIGLIADAPTTAAVAQDFRVFYRKAGDTSGPNYTVDHSTGTYIFDTEGRLRLYVKHGTEPAAIVADVKTLLAGK